MTLGTLQKALIEGVVEDPSLARKIASAGRVYSGIAAADTNATNAHARLNDPQLIGKYQLDLSVQSVVGALALANLPPIPQEKLNAITDPSKLVSATLGVLQNASANQAGYAGFQSAVGANLLAAWTVVAGRAIIAQATIQDEHVANLSANKLSAGTISTGTINIQTLLRAGSTSIDTTGITMASVGSFAESSNSNHSSKLTSTAGVSDNVTFGALGFAVDNPNLRRGALLAASGIAGGAVDGLIRLAAVTNPNAALSAASSAFLDVQSHYGAAGSVDAHADFNVYGATSLNGNVSATGAIGASGTISSSGNIISLLGNFGSGGQTMSLITAGASVVIPSGSLVISSGNLTTPGGRLIAPYELTATPFSPSGAQAFQRAHGLGRVPWRVNIQYTSATLTSWYDAPPRSAGSDVSYNYDVTNIYFYNNRTENVTIRMQAF